MDALANCSASARDSRISRMLKTAGADGNPGLLPDEFIPDEWIKQIIDSFQLLVPANQLKTHSKEGRAPGTFLK
jgi:hypothetical protein